MRVATLGGLESRLQAVRLGKFKDFLPSKRTTGQQLHRLKPWSFAHKMIGGPPQWEHSPAQEFAQRAAVFKPSPTAHGSGVWTFFNTAMASQPGRTANPSAQGNAPHAGITGRK